MGHDDTMCHAFGSGDLALFIRGCCVVISGKTHALHVYQAFKEEVRGTKADIIPDENPVSLHSRLWILFMTTPYHTISYHTLPHHTTPHHTISYHIISYHTTSYHTISYHIIPYHIISYHIISYLSYPVSVNCALAYFSPLRKLCKRFLSHQPLAKQKLVRAAYWKRHCCKSESIAYCSCYTHLLTRLVIHLH